MSIFCAECGAAMPEISSFCPDCGNPVRAAVPSKSETSDGDAIAAPGAREGWLSALAYITFIPALVFLLVEPFKGNARLRFHAFQSIGFTIATVALFILVRILSVPLFLIRDWGLLLVALISLAASLGWFVLWMVLLTKAVVNERFCLPFIGRVAEQWAGGSQVASQVGTAP
jgi:uncharacterized membrane protein